MRKGWSRHFWYPQQRFNAAFGCLFIAYAIRYAVLLLVFITASTFAQASDSSKQYQLDIPAQIVEDALQRLAKQTGKQLLFSHQTVDTLTSKAVKGRYSLQQALQQMLIGTGLSADQTDSGVIVVTSVNQRSNRDRRGINMNSKKNLLAATVAFFMGSGAAVVSAVDQNQVEELNQRGIDEVIVTAQRREQRLIDVPISITAIGEDTIKNTGVKTIADLSYHVSNFSVVDFAPGSTNYYIRGVANGSGSAPLVGVYLDEMPLSPSQFFAISLQTTDIKRVEVLKGPQGTLFGQGSVGGTIRYITNSPNMEDFEGSVGTSLFDTKGGRFSEELNAVLNIPMVTDTLAFRIAAKYSDQGGWIDQPTVGKEDANDSLMSDIRITGLWRVSDEFDVKLMINRNREALGAGNDTNGGPHSTNYYLPAVNDLDVSATGLDNAFDLSNIELNYDWGNIRLMSSTSMVDAESTRGIFVEEWELDAPLAGQNSFDFVRSLYVQDAKGFSQEFRLVGQSEALNWTIGALYADVEESVLVTSGIYKFGDLFFGGVPNIFNEIKSSKSEAIYGELSYDISEKLTFSLGGRYFKDDRSYESPAGADSLSASFDKVSFSFKASYAATDSSNIYLNISEGFRSGGFNANGITYKPEDLVTYDLGVKAAFMDGRINVDGAIFFSDYNDYQSLTEITVASTSTTITGNPGEVEMEGLELSVQFQLVDNLNVGLSGGVVNAEFVKTDPSVTSTLPGDSVANIPKYSYSAMLDYDFTWFSSVAGFFHLDYSRSAKRKQMIRGAFFDRELETTDIGFLNVQLGASIDNFTVRVFSNNLGNELRTSFPLITAPSHNFQRRPRTIGVDINYDF